MKIKLTTPIGCVCLKNRNVEETVKSVFAEVCVGNAIEERVIMDAKAKSYYKVATPFGRAYVRDYSWIGSEERLVKNIFKNTTQKEIEFIAVN